MEMRRPAIRITASPMLRKIADDSRGLRNPTEGPSAIMPTATIKRISRIFRRSISSRVCFAIAIVTMLRFAVLHLGDIHHSARRGDRGNKYFLERSPMRNDGDNRPLCGAHDIDDIGNL